MARDENQMEKAGQEPGIGDKMGEQLASKLIEMGIAGAGPMGPAAAAADKTLGENGGDRERAIKDIVASSQKLAAAGGFASGFGGFVTMLVALPANVVGFYVIATRMVAQIAHLRGYDVSKDEVRSAVLLTLLGADATEVLGEAGVLGRVVGMGTKSPVMGLATRGLPKPALMVLNKAVAFRLISRVGARAVPRLGKFVPVLGGVIGAGLDGMLMKRIAKNAIEEFAPHRGGPRPPRGGGGARGPGVPRPPPSSRRRASRLAA